MKRYLPLERNQAGIIQDRYGCALCWNRVIVGHDQGGDYLDCGTPDCKCEGLVSLKWVDRQIEENHFKAITARRLLQDIYPWIKKPVKVRLDQEQLLKELGY
jgi:hypothetical protein